MLSLFLLAGYLLTGAALIHGALYISHYDLEMDGFDKARFIAMLVIIWPLFLLPMLGYWGWVAYHGTKSWVKSL
jgi:hypothetical protein